MLTYRDAGSEDLPRLKEWVEVDPFHKGVLSGEFWIPKIEQDGTKEKGIKCLTVSDENGVVFNLKLVNVMRVYVQFQPEGDPIRVGTALKEAFGFISAGAKKLGYHEMLFDSISKPLIRFFSKFGFAPLEDTFKVNL